MTLDEKQEKNMENSKDEFEPLVSKPDGDQSEADIERHSTAPAPACNLVWTDEGYVMECITQEDIELALDLLKQVRFTLGRGDTETKHLAETKEATDDDDSDRHL